MGVRLARNRNGEALLRSGSGDRAGRRLTLDEIARLTEAFSDSDLPIKVDLIDWRNVEDRWRQTIVAERIALTEVPPRTPAGD